MKKLAMPLIFAAVDGSLLYTSHRSYDDYGRCRFDNTTAGGVVEFAHYEAMKAHERLAMFAKLPAIFGTLILLFSTLVPWKVS